jgi:hypothetical protein
MDFFNVYGPLPYEEAKWFLMKMSEPFHNLYLKENGEKNYDRIKNIWNELNFDKLDIVLYRDISNSIMEMQMSDYPKLGRSIRRFFPGWERLEKDSIPQ